MAEPNTLTKRSATDLPLKAWSWSARTYLAFLIGVIGVLLLLSGDFGRSWDMSLHEYNGLKAWDFYFHGFDVQKFKNEHYNIHYGPVVDVIIGLIQNLTSDPIQKFKVRIFIEALLSLSCLIPIFLICARVLQRPFALIGVALVLGTPAFFGHAFINPIDSLAVSGFLWSLWLILYCFQEGQRNDWGFVGLGLLLGVTASIRYVIAYLFLLVPLSIALARKDRGTPPESGDLLRQQAQLPYRGLAILLVTFIVVYTLTMPVILSSFGPKAYLDVMRKFAHIEWPGSILYFGRELPAQQLPWHYVYGYMLVQLPLYYHLFAATVVVAVVGWPERTLRTFRGVCPQRQSTILLLLVALIVPCVLIFLVRPVLYDGFRHVLFIVPLLCLLLYFGFAFVLRQIGKLGRIVLITLAAAFWIQSATAMVRLHPYEYTYYNPLVNPAHSFELDYWATSFREVADRLNHYARQSATTGAKLRVWVCGPADALQLFLDPERFEVVDQSAAQLAVLLNRGGCLNALKGPPLISVGRGDLIFAVVGRS
jgi:4-amino-4-deoxy-L-arabinose transferase-like glycosyltransferase